MVKSILITIYDGCDGEHCQDKECTHGNVSVEGNEFAEITTDNPKAINKLICSYFDVT